MTGMVGWPGDFEAGKRPWGVHPWAVVGAPPESRKWLVGDPYLEPELGFRCLIDAFCTIDAGMPGLPTTRVGNHTWLQKRVHVGHNARIGNRCEIAVGVTVCGEVVIGDGVKIGGNSWVKPQVKIGHGAIIGGGSVVTKDVPAHEVWAGNPARFLKRAWSHPANTPAFEGSTPLYYPAVGEVLEYRRAEWDREVASSGGPVEVRSYESPSCGAAGLGPDWMRGVT